MKTTPQIRRLAKQLFRGCFVNGLPDENRAEQVTRDIVQAQQRDSLAVLSYFRRLAKLYEVEHAAQVESAIPLSRDQQGRIEAGLSRAYGPGLSFSFVSSPSLIGGMRIKVGSDVFDGSVRTRLESLEESF